MFYIYIYIYGIYLCFYYVYIFNILAVLPLCPSLVAYKSKMIHIHSINASRRPVNKSQCFRYICKYIRRFAFAILFSPSSNSYLNYSLECQKSIRHICVCVKILEIYLFFNENENGLIGLTCMYLSGSFSIGHTKGLPPSPEHVPAPSPWKQLNVLCRRKFGRLLSRWLSWHSLLLTPYIAIIFRTLEKAPRSPKIKSYWEHISFSLLL